MKIVATLAIVASIFLSGCAHQIELNPKTDAFVESSNKSDAVVGYHISDELRNKKVTSPGGGGDKVTYTPYKDTETVLYQVLSNKFKDVYLVKSLDDKTFVADNGIQFIFVPTLSTESSSSSFLTWPPTTFIVTIDAKAVDAEGNTVWDKQVVGTGLAEFDEFKSDFSLSARRATESAFLALAGAIDNADVFK